MPYYQHTSSQYSNFPDCLMCFCFCFLNSWSCLNPDKVYPLHLVPISLKSLFPSPWPFICCCLSFTRSLSSSGSAPLPHSQLFLICIFLFSQVSSILTPGFKRALASCGWEVQVWVTLQAHVALRLSFFIPLFCSSPCGPRPPAGAFLVTTTCHLLRRPFWHPQL